jgi:nitroreductase
MNIHEREKILWIIERRSVRSFDDREIDDSTIGALLVAGMAAPSACAKDPWRFVIIRDKRMLAKIADGLPNGKFLVAASVGIVVCGDLEAAHDRQESYLLQDCSAAIENILLAACRFKIGTCWLGIHPRTDRINHVQSLLNMPSGIIPVACLACGYSSEIKIPRTRMNKEYIHLEKW